MNGVERFRLLFTEELKDGMQGLTCSVVIRMKWTSK